MPDKDISIKNSRSLFLNSKINSLISDNIFVKEDILNEDFKFENILKKIKILILYYNENTSPITIKRGLINDSVNTIIDNQNIKQNFNLNIDELMSQNKYFEFLKLFGIINIEDILSKIFIFFDQGRQKESLTWLIKLLYNEKKYIDRENQILNQLESIKFLSKDGKLYLPDILEKEDKFENIFSNLKDIKFLNVSVLSNFSRDSYDFLNSFFLKIGIKPQIYIFQDQKNCEDKMNDKRITKQESVHLFYLIFKLDFEKKLGFYLKNLYNKLNLFSNNDDTKNCRSLIMGDDFKQNNDDWDNENFNAFVNKNHFLHFDYLNFFKNKLSCQTESNKNKFKQNDIIVFFSYFVLSRKVLYDKYEKYISDEINLEKSKLLIKFLYNNFSKNPVDFTLKTISLSIKIFSESGIYKDSNTLYLGDVYENNKINEQDFKDLKISKILCPSYLVNKVYLDNVKNDNFPNFVSFLKQIGIKENNLICQDFKRLYNNKFSIEFLKFFILHQKDEKNFPSNNEVIILLNGEDQSQHSPENLYFDDSLDEKLKFEKYIPKSNIISKQYLNFSSNQYQKKMINLLKKIGVKSQTDYIMNIYNPSDNVLIYILYLYITEKIQIPNNINKFKVLNSLNNLVISNTLYFGDFFNKENYLAELNIENFLIFNKSIFLNNNYLIKIKDLLKVENLIYDTKREELLIYNSKNVELKAMQIYSKIIIN